MLRKFFDYLGPVPRPRDLVTFVGMCNLCGAFTSAMHLFIFQDWLGWVHWVWWIISATCAVALVARLLVGMKFPRYEALVIAIGGLCIALPVWPTFQLHFTFPLWQGAILIVAGLIISMPPFARRIVEFHQRNPA